MPKNNHFPQKNLSLAVCLALAAFCLLIAGGTPVFALNLDSLKIYFLQGDYKNAISEGEKLIAQDKHATGSDELYFILGLSYLKDGNYLRASDIFEIILGEFKESKFREESFVCLGDTYLLRQDYAKAGDCYEKLIKSSPASKFKPLVYSRLSQVGFKKGDTGEGKSYLEKLKTEFPESVELITNKDIPAAGNVSANFFYTVQVGAFSNIVNARNFTRELIQKGYPAFNEEVNLNGKTSYRVKIGKLNTLSEAKGLAGKLAREGYPTRICP